MSYYNYLCYKDYFSKPENHTYEKYLEAVKQDGFALEFVKEQTSELCLEAVKQN